MATCSIETLIADACESKFTCLDDRIQQALVLQLLCNISQSGSLGAVDSVFGRSGVVVAQSGDYTASQVTNAFDTSTVRSANTVYAGPTTGAAAAPTFRSLVVADIPVTAFNVQFLSVPAGNNGETDYIGKTPAFAGQLGIAFFGNKKPYLYYAGTTTVSDWKYAFNWPTGFNHVGSPDSMDSDVHTVEYHLNGSTTGYTRSGDSALIVENWSTNTNNSGGGLGVAVMRWDGVNDKAVLVDLVGCAFNHVPSNRIASLIPGNAMLVFNAHATHLKGLAICGPNLSGFDSGNYSVAYFDFSNDLFRIPLWTASKYQPSDAGWRDALTISPASGVALHYGNVGVRDPAGGGDKITLASVTGDVTFIGKLISSNGSGITQNFYGSNGGTWAITVGATDEFLLSKNLGLTLTRVGQGISIKEGTNATMGTLTLNGATEVTVNTTKVTANSRIFLSVQAPAGTPAGAVFVSSRVAATSFGVKGVALDTSTVAWMIVEPA